MDQPEQFSKDAIRQKIDEKIPLSDAEELFYMVEMLGLSEAEAQKMINRRKSRRPGVITD